MQCVLTWELPFPASSSHVEFHSIPFVTAWLRGSCVQRNKERTKEWGNEGKREIYNHGLYSERVVALALVVSKWNHSSIRVFFSFYTPMSELKRYPSLTDCRVTSSAISGLWSEYKINMKQLLLVLRLSTIYRLENVVFVWEVHEASTIFHLWLWLFRRVEYSAVRGCVRACAYLSGNHWLRMVPEIWFESTGNRRKCQSLAAAVLLLQQDYHYHPATCSVANILWNKLIAVAD